MICHHALDDGISHIVCACVCVCVCEGGGGGLDGGWKTRNKNRFQKGFL